MDDYVKCKKVRFISNSTKDDLNIKNNILSGLIAKGFTVDIKDDRTLHDRWWFSRKDGFLIGTSFNGLQRKDTIMKMLDADEVNHLIDKFGI